MKGTSLWLAVLLAILLFVDAIPSRISSSTSSNLSPTRNEASPEEENSKPNIIMILADDMGWNDVSFHGSNQILTPNIDALAYNGVILNNHYVAPLCTPSRASLLTGKYPIHTGMQHLVLLESEPRGLPLREKLLPEYLREAGYKTHAVGKWHLGYHHREYTPTYRGFDSHFGYWNGLQDYYSHMVESTVEGYRGFDMRRNMSVAWDTAGKYSTDLFTEEAVRLIKEHNKKKPMFMYLAHLAPHTGNKDAPFQAPDEEIVKFGHIEDPERRIYAAMVSKLDQSVGEIVTALRHRDMLQNSIIIFMSDNGAPTMGIHSNRGSNYPLRGIKAGAWEGAVRGVAAIWSPLIKNPKRVSNHLMHVADWLPSLYSAAGLDPKNLGNIDGIDLWATIVSEKNNLRSEVLINIDEIENYAAIRRGDFKYVIGSFKNGEFWYGETGRPEQEKIEGISPEYKPQEILMSRAGIAISGFITSEQVKDIRAFRKSKIPGWKPRVQMLTSHDILKLRRDAELKCNVKKEEEVACIPLESPCLFNIKEDPCERKNLAQARPLILGTLEEALLKYRVTAMPASNVENDPNSSPVNWNGIWVNWKDPNPIGFSISQDDKPFELPGSAIAVIGIILGLLVVGIFIVIGLKCANKSSSDNDSLADVNFKEIQDRSPSPEDPDASERRTFQISKELSNCKATNSLKDLARNID